MRRNFTQLFTLIGVAGCSLTMNAADTAFGYMFQSKDDRHGFSSFAVGNPQKVTLHKSNYDYIHPSAGEYVDGKIYTYLVEFGDFSDIYPTGWAVYDGQTYSQLAKASTANNRVVDMAYDYTTNTMYALMEDKYTTGTVSPTSLYAVDLATGELTFIGTPGELTALDGYNRVDTDGLITLACSPDGQLYGMTHYRYLYRIDKFTGKVESAAPRHNLGTAEQFQSMAFDAEGKLWWAQQHPSYGHFCEIDLTTGIPGGFVDFRTDYEKLNKLGDDIQLTCLYFKDKQVRPNSVKAVSDLTATLSDADVHTVNLSWKLPEADYSGKAAQATAIKVYRLGTSEPIATLSGDATSYSDTAAPDGFVGYEILTATESGNGFPAFARTFAGYDVLKPVSNITVQLDGNVATVKWDAPTATVNGGYSDFENITYNIYRGKNSELSLVASDVDACEFTETIAETGGFAYTIEPVSGNVAGQKATSDVFVIASSKTLPYFTSFEDDQDGSEWTFNNKNTNGRGWQIGKKSYVFEGDKTAIASTGGSSALGDDWIFSPAIEMEAGPHIVTFYGNGASYDTHTFTMAFGTDAADTESFSIPVYSLNNDYIYDKDGEVSGWKRVEVNVEIPESGLYHLGIHNMTQTTYANLRIDNLSIKRDPASAITDVTDEANSFSVAAMGGTIIVESAAPMSRIDLYDAQGRAVRTVNANAASATISGAAKGFYIIGVTFADGTKAARKIAL